MTAVPLTRHLPRSAVRAIPMSLRRRRWYYRAFGRRLSLRRPATFMAKVNWRIVHDRRALLQGTCDKLWMKDHALRTAPGLVRVPETYWSGTDIAELAEVDLPERWVLKPNHSTRLVILGVGRPDVAELARLTQGWLEEDLAARTGEWAYGSARRLLLVEELIGEPGETPPDYKVYVFDGVPRLVQVHTGRFGEPRVRAYAPDWEPLDWHGGLPMGPDMPRPRCLEEMVKAATAMAEGYDMLRVDFYEHDGVLWFGELTPYPGSGLVQIDPVMDQELGRWWHLPDTVAG